MPLHLALVALLAGLLLQGCASLPQEVERTPSVVLSNTADTPLGRPGQPAELAAIYVLLASAESSYATGQVYGAAAGRGGP